MTEEPNEQNSADWHHHRAEELFNAAWGHLEQRKELPEEGELALFAAFGSLYHRCFADRILERVHGEWMVAHVAILIGQFELGLHYAQRSLLMAQEHGYGGYDLAYCHAEVARAFSYLGNKAECKKYRNLAIRAANEIDNPEALKEFEDSFSGEDWNSLD